MKQFNRPDFLTGDVHRSSRLMMDRSGKCLWPSRSSKVKCIPLSRRWPVNGYDNPSFINDVSHSRLLLSAKCRIPYEVSSKTLNRYTVGIRDRPDIWSNCLGTPFCDMTQEETARSTFAKHKLPSPRLAPGSLLWA